MTTTFRSAASTSHPNVDRAAGIIRNVSVISEGQARGHDLYIDGSTLAQVKSCAAAFGPSGLAVKFNPSTFSHGPASYAGNVQNLRIVGPQLLGELHILKSYPDREYLFELAETQPANFGLSIDFEMHFETKGGRDFARCAAIDAVTIVDVPAANANGLFRKQPRTTLPAFFKAHSMKTTHATFAATPSGFTARLEHHRSRGLSAGRAIQLAAKEDSKGFNQWSAAGRPGNRKQADSQSGGWINSKFKIGGR